jgi:hypothetical protein
MPGVPDWLGDAATWAGAVAVILGLGFTGCQIRLARETQQATIIYSSEKDFHDLFVKTAGETFKKCFGPSLLPPACTSDDARSLYFDLLSYYQMLLDLEQLNSIGSDYVDAKIDRFCLFVKSPGGVAAIKDFKRQSELLERGLVSRLASRCQVTL